MSDNLFESRILRFERAWQRNEPHEIVDFLPHAAPSSSDSRRRLLLELICIDLEFRWRNSRRTVCVDEPFTLENYVAKFPELGPIDDIPLELIAEEYRVRRLWGDRPTDPEYVSRFPERQEAIRTLIDQIHGELEEELADPRQAADAVHISRPTFAPPVLNGPLLSHHDFLLQRMIGAGRMGKVYRSWQHSACRAVAVKFLRKSFLDQPVVVQRFVGEASTIAKLDHPNIVGIQGLGRTPGGAFFIVMELVSGPNLDHIVSTRAISVDEALRWAIEACHALEHAHARGVIHCDLKPANLLLEHGGRVRLTDFGLARSRTEVTASTAEIEGTAPYMAPEQASRVWGEIDVQTDVYGVGAVLFALLTGRPPFNGRRLTDVLADVVSAVPVISPSSLRPDLPQAAADLCRKCLSKSREDRYPTVRDVRLALSELIAGR